MDNRHPFGYSIQYVVGLAVRQREPRPSWFNVVSKLLGGSSSDAERGAPLHKVPPLARAVTSTTETNQGRDNAKHFQCLGETAVPIESRCTLHCCIDINLQSPSPGKISLWVKWWRTHIFHREMIAFAKYKVSSILNTLYLLSSYYPNSIFVCVLNKCV